MQAITTRQSNQNNNNQTTTSPTPSHHQTTTTNNTTTTSNQFKATTTNASKLIAYEYIVDQGKNFTSGCPVTDSKMVSFWFRTEIGALEAGQRSISWDKQVRAGKVVFIQEAIDLKSNRFSSWKVKKGGRKGAKREGNSRLNGFNFAANKIRELCNSRRQHAGQ